MITFVRRHADTDAVDAPDSNLEVYARAAYNDIRRRVPEWVDNHVSDTLAVSSGVAAYALSGSAFSTKNVEYVTSITGPSENLVYIPWSVYLEMLDGPDVDYSTREASWYTVKGDAVYLFPTPATAGVEYTVYGYRSFTSWPSGSDEPDLPREFDEVICWYMLGMYYRAQEDISMSQLYMAQYEQGVNRFIASSMKQDSHSPKIFGGSKKNRYPMSYSRWLRRNTEGV